MIVICGRTCAGKDTLGKWLEERHGFEKVISYTTRPPREGEINGKDYYFETSATFDKMRSNGDFAETTDYKQENGDIWSYGTHVNSYKDTKKKKYVILNPEGIYQLVNRDIHFDLFYLDNKHKETLEKRYLNRETKGYHTNLDTLRDKFETRWKQDEKDFNAFDEWLKKAKTEEGLPNQIESICRISMIGIDRETRKSCMSGVTRKLKELGYIDGTIKPDEFKEILDKREKEFEVRIKELKEENEKLKKENKNLEGHIEMLACRNVPLQDEIDILKGENEKLRKELAKTEDLKKDYDEFRDRYRITLNRANELESKNYILNKDLDLAKRRVERFQKEYDELYENYSNSPDKSVIEELEHKLKQAEMARDFWYGASEGLKDRIKNLEEKYESHKKRHAVAYEELKLKYYNECDINRTRIVYLEDMLDKYQKKCEEMKKTKEENDILKKQDDKLLMVLAMTVSYLENKEDPKNER